MNSLENLDQLFCSTHFPQSADNVDATQEELSPMDDSEDEDDVPLINVPRVGRAYKKYLLSQVYHDLEEAKKAAREKGNYSIQYTNTDKYFNKHITFRCTTVKVRGTQCSASKLLVVMSNSNKNNLFHSEDCHNCDQSETKSLPPLSDKYKEKVKEIHLSNFRVSPLVVLRRLSPDFHPSFCQVRSYLREVQSIFNAQNAPTIGQLEEFFNQNSITPNEPNRPFVVRYELSPLKSLAFRFFASTLNLLSRCESVQHLCADATHWVIWHGYPVLLVGTTDMDNSFVIFGIAVVMSETTEDFEFLFNSLKYGASLANVPIFSPKVIISDAAHAISNGFKKVFGSNSISIMCWFHVMAATRKFIRSFKLDDDVKHQLVKDIQALQLSNTPQVFQQASSFFIEKWGYLATFVEYFQKQWLEENPNWFEGAHMRVPKTNNALESYNNIIKGRFLFRCRQPLGEFILSMFTMLSSWSSDYLDGRKVIAKVPTICLATFTKAFNLLHERRTISKAEYPTYWRFGAFSSKWDRA